MHPVSRGLRGAPVRAGLAPGRGMTGLLGDVVVNGALLHAETHGPEDAPALVILHGGPGVGDCRSQVRDYGALADEFRLVLYDSRGSGRSEEKPPYTHEQ